MIKCGNCGKPIHSCPSGDRCAGTGFVHDLDEHFCDGQLTEAMPEPWHTRGSLTAVTDDAVRKILGA